MMSTPWWGKGASSNAGRSGQGKRGRLVASEQRFLCGLCKGEEGI